MFGVSFEKQAPVITCAPNRVDIACFVGYTGRRGTKVPIELDRWLTEHWPDRYSRRPTVELKASDPLPDPINFDFTNNAMHLVINGETGAISLPSDEMTQAELVDKLNEATWIANAHVNSEDKLVITGDDLVSLTVRRHAILGFNIDATAHDLMDVPIPIDNWESFDFLFAWDRRDLDRRGATGSSYLGAAVRTFFAQGGRKCYIVCVGEPWTLASSQEERSLRMIERLGRLIPGFPYRLSVSPVDKKESKGVGHIFHLPDVSFLCLPDLADAVAVEPFRIEAPESPPVPEEQFVECSEPSKGDIAHSEARWFRAPRCDDVGYTAWSKAVGLVVDMLRFHRIEAQLVAAIPIPQDDAAAEKNVLEYLVDRGRGPLTREPDSLGRGMASDYLQLVYPWVRTSVSGALPERLESPDAVLAGVLARNALLRGTYRCAASMHLADVYEVVPTLWRDQLLKSFPANHGKDTIEYSLLERVSLLGPTVDGLMLLSDVSASLNESYRPACVRRLVSAIVRAARRLGEEMVFESSNERLWATVRERLSNLLTGLLEAGALRGESPSEAFHVRCDRSTMTQNDIDNGRLIAHVWFIASSVVEKITVVLAMHEGGSVSLVSPETIQVEVET